jgi:predicted O-methyltransferase YrrM
MRDELIELVKVSLPKIHGWCTLEKATSFVDLILENKPELCIEIGIFGGSSYIPQALALRENGKGLIIGIDPWTTDAALEEMIHEDHKNWWGNLRIEEIYEHAKQNIKDFSVEKYCTLIRAKAEDVVNQFENESVDLLHIDGNHSEALSYKDATLYLPKVKVGGHIMFDDIWWTEEGNYVTTRKAIVYLMEYCDQIDIINNDCLLLKKIKPC